MPHEGHIDCVRDLVTKNDVSVLVDGGWLEETATQTGRAGGLCNTLGVTGLSLDIVNGGTYHVTTPNRGFFKLGGTGSRIRVEDGSLLLSDITEYNWGSGFGNAEDCTIALTNATMTVFVFRFGLDSKKATGCRLLVHDSTFSMNVPQATPDFTGRRYFEWRSGYSVSNEMVVSGSSVASGFSTFDMNGTWDLLRIRTRPRPRSGGDEWRLEPGLKCWGRAVTGSLPGQWPVQPVAPVGRSVGDGKQRNIEMVEMGRT